MLASFTANQLFNGISELDIGSRMYSQCEDSLNALPTVARGLEKRPSTWHVADIGALWSNNPYAHLYEASDGEKYIILFGGGLDPIKAFDLSTGAEVTVSSDLGLAHGGYFSADDPQADIRVVSVADHMIITNRSVTPAITQVDNDESYQEAYVWVETHRANTDYVMSIFDADGELIIECLKDPLDAIGSHEIIEGLFNDLEAATLPTWLEYELIGDIDDDSTTAAKTVLRVWSNDGTTFSVSTSDDYSGDLLNRVFGKAEKPADLPPYAADGSYVEITGGDTADNLSYYVRFDREDRSWKECVKEGIDNVLTASTMPHTISRHFDEYDDPYFLVERVSWDDRMVGDDDTAPVPSFVGGSIIDVVYYKARLGFVTSSSIVLSRADDLFNFWPTTATDILDDDPVDVSVDVSNTNVTLAWGVTAGESIHLFSAQGQFVLKGADDGFGPKTALLRPATAYGAYDVVRPTASGSALYFLANSGAGLQLREYFAQTDEVLNVAPDVTAHVPSLLAASAGFMVSVNNHDLILIGDGADATMLYAYKYYWSGEEKPQSCWSRWTFPWEIVASVALMDTVYFLASDDAGSTYSIYRMDLGVPEADIVIDGIREVTVEGDRYGSDLPTFDTGESTDTDAWWDDEVYVAALKVNLDYVDGVTVLTTDTVLLPDTTITPQASSELAVSLDAYADELTANGGTLLWGKRVDFSHTFSEFAPPHPQSREPNLGGQTRLRGMTLRLTARCLADLTITSGSRSDVQVSINMVNNLLGNFGDMRPTDFRAPFIANPRDTEIVLSSTSSQPLRLSAVTWHYTHNHRGSVI